MLALHASGAAVSWVEGRMGTDAHLYHDDAAIPAFPNSRFDADEVDALKRLLAIVAQGIDAGHLFQQLNNVAAPSMEVKQNKAGAGSWTVLATPSIARHQFDEMPPILLLRFQSMYVNMASRGLS